MQTVCVSAYYEPQYTLQNVFLDASILKFINYLTFLKNMNNIY